MNSSKKIFIVVMIMVSCLGKTLFSAEIEQDIPLSSIPLKVTTAAQQEISALQLMEAAKITDDNGDVIYELEGTKDTVTYVIQVDNDGKVIKSGPEKDFEEERAERQLSTLPANVREAVEQSQEGIRLTGFATEVEGGQLIYEVKGIADGQCYEIEVTQAGQVLETEKCD